MMPAGVALTPPPSWTSRPTGFKIAPELIVPLVVTLIVLPAEAGIAVAELSAKIPAPLAVSVLSSPVETLMLPLLPVPCAKAPIPNRPVLESVVPAPRATVMSPVPTVNA